jgi:NAD(P)-dependent dehydrogenase (short-subunit alcohol dehydrogenase family)
MLESFASLLKKSNATPCVVNVSTGNGSITMRLDPTSIGYSIKDVQYRPSKAALNMVTACQAVEYCGLGFKMCAYCPGLYGFELGTA